MSIDSIIKITANIPANQVSNSLAQVDMPEDGLIVAVGGLLVSNGGLVAQDHNIIAEVSFLSTNQLQINDSRGTIAGIGVSYSSFAANGIGKTSEQVALHLPEGIPVQAGERIHLHANSTIAALTGIATFLLYIKLLGGARRAHKRR